MPVATVTVNTVVEGASVLAWKMPLAVKFPVTVREPVPTAPLVEPAVGVPAFTANEPDAGCACRILVEVPVDVEPSVPRAKPPIGAVTKVTISYPSQVAIDPEGNVS